MKQISRMDRGAGRVDAYGVQQMLVPQAGNACVGQGRVRRTKRRPRHERYADMTNTKIASQGAHTSMKTRDAFEIRSDAGRFNRLLQSRMCARRLHPRASERKLKSN